MPQSQCLIGPGKPFLWHISSTDGSKTSICSIHCFDCLFLDVFATLLVSIWHFEDSQNPHGLAVSHEDNLLQNHLLGTFLSLKCPHFPFLDTPSACIKHPSSSPRPRLKLLQGSSHWLEQALPIGWNRFHEVPPPFHYLPYVEGDSHNSQIGRAHV